MTTGGDPYRTLGLAPGASVNEIRSAYRRLAKRYHPDAAGERAIPRFLAIQAAYEQLVDANGNLRRQPRGSGAPGGPTRRGTPGGRGGAGDPWRADPSRAQASRDAWRARRSGAGAGGTAGPNRAAGPDRPAGSAGTEGSDRGAGPAAPAGSADDAAGAAGAGSARSSQEGPGSQRRTGTFAEGSHRRQRRKATPGSTTYDEASDAERDPSWTGGAWYGPTMGTYWTLNPREYADPRRHGPEYQRRAWRLSGRAPSSPPGTDAGQAQDGAGARNGAGARDPAETRGRAPTSDAADAARQPGSSSPAGAGVDPTAGPTRDEGGPPGAPGAPGAPPGTPSASQPGSTWGLLEPLLPEGLLARAGGPVIGWRVGLALVAAAPVALLANAAFEVLAACTPGACPPLVPLLAVIAWLVGATVLAAFPVGSALGVIGVIAGALAAIVTAVVVGLATGDPSSAVRNAAGTVGAVVYCFALVMGAISLWRGGGKAAPTP